MKPSILIVSPLYPPARGGVADHTQRLAEELSAQADVSVLTSLETVGAAAIRICPLIRDWSNAPELLRILSATTAQTAILWQYVPHMYGRGGVNLALPKVMAAVRKRGRRQIVIAHEIAAPFSPWPHRFWYALAHRWQWRRILQEADAMGISTEAWLEQWTRRTPQFRDRLFLLPSPSTVPVVPVPAGHAEKWRQDYGLPANARLLGYFGTLSPAKQFQWIIVAWQESQTPEHPVALVVLGDRPLRTAPKQLAPLYRPLGYRSAAEVSAALQAMDVLALPFVDGVSERRTSFMAGLSHGCGIVTTIGANTGTSLRHANFFESSPGNSAMKFVDKTTSVLNDQPRRFELEEAGKHAYRKLYDWGVITQKIETKLGHFNPARD